MSPLTPAKPSQKRKADVIGPGQVLQPSRKRNQTEPQSAATQRDPSKLYTVIDMFYATPAQLASGTGIRAENTAMTFRFLVGDAAMHMQLWAVAEQHWQQARQQAGLSLLKNHLRSSSLRGEPTVILRSWLLYQVGMAELEVGTRHALGDASAHLRASQSLGRLFYPASVALGVCHVLLGQTKDGEAALRRGLWMREQLVAPGTSAAIHPLMPTDAPSLLCFVVTLMPTWTMAHRARDQATAMQVQHNEVAAKAARAAAQYARLATPSVISDGLANEAALPVPPEMGATPQPGESTTP